MADALVSVRFLKACGACCIHTARSSGRRRLFGQSNSSIGGRSFVVGGSPADEGCGSTFAFGFRPAPIRLPPLGIGLIDYRFDSGFDLAKSKTTSQNT